jgi:hypothetical protein
MTTTHDDQHAPKPVSDPVFKTQAELEAWAAKTARDAEVEVMTVRPIDFTPRLMAINRIRRVTHAHLHLREGESA